MHILLFTLQTSNDIDDAHMIKLSPSVINEIKYYHKNVNMDLIHCKNLGKR